MATSRGFYLHYLGFYGFVGLLGSLLPVGDSQSSCGQAGWVRWEDGASCYFKSPPGVAYDKSRDEAKLACSIMGGHLTSIVDQTEWEFIRNNVIGADASDQYWIGLQKTSGSTDPQSASVDRVNWQWMDQLPYSYRWNNWFDGPNDEPSGEAPCVRLFAQGFWGDTFCYNKFRYICKIRDIGGFTKQSTIATPSTTPKTTTTTTAAPTRRTTTFHFVPSSTTRLPKALPTSATISPRTSNLVSKLVTNTVPQSTIRSSQRASIVPTLYTSNNPKPSIVPSNIPPPIRTTTRRRPTPTRRTYTPRPPTTSTRKTPLITSSNENSLGQASAYSDELNLPIIIGVTLAALTIMGGTVGLGAFLLYRRRKKGPDEEVSSVPPVQEEMTDTHRGFYVGERSTKDDEPLPTWPEEDEEAVARDNSGLI